MLVVSDDLSGPDFDPINVIVELEDRSTEALIGYLNRGLTEQARRIGVDLIKGVREPGSLLEKPSLWCVIGYYLLTMPNSDSWTSWLQSRELVMREYRWYPDFAVILAWHALRYGQTDWEAARKYLLKAEYAGLPVFTRGLRLLYDGLDLLARRDEKDTQVAWARERLQPFAQAARWEATTTSYYGRAPWKPELPDVTELQSDTTD